METEKEAMEAAIGTFKKRRIIKALKNDPSNYDDPLNAFWNAAVKFGKEQEAREVAELMEEMLSSGFQAIDLNDISYRAYWEQKHGWRIWREADDAPAIEGEPVCVAPRLLACLRKLKESEGK